MQLRRGLLMGMANEKFRLLADITTDADATGIDVNLGRDCDEVIIVVRGKYKTGTTGYNFAINMSADEQFSSTGTNNKVYETNQFFNNNPSEIVCHILALGEGCHIFEAAGSIYNGNGERMGFHGAEMGGKFYDSSFPSKIRYLHIGSINNTAIFETGVKVKVWGR